MQSQDVGMLEIGGGLDLLEEPGRPDHRCELGPEDLQGHLAVVPEILGQEHGGHPALAELAFDLVTIRESLEKSAFEPVAHGAPWRRWALRRT